MKEVWITPDSAFSYCTSCLPENGYIKTKFPNHSPEIIAFYEQNLLQYTKIPPHNPDCERIFSSGAPRITSPVDGLDYFIDRIDSTEMMLTCQAANDVEKVYWYVNDRFYSVALAGEKIFFTPAPGKIKISCTDDKGRNTDIRVNVQYVDF